MPRQSVVKLTDRPYMTLDVYHGRKTTTTTKLQIRRGSWNNLVIIILISPPQKHIL